MTTGGGGSDTNALLSSHETATVAGGGGGRASWQEGEGVGMKSSTASAGGSGLGTVPGPGLGTLSGGVGSVSATSGISNVVPVNDHMGDVRLVEVTFPINIPSYHTLSIQPINTPS